MPILDCTDLSKHYDDRTILAAVSLTIRRGEKVGLVGGNGCGKSTLARVLSGIEERDGGSISRRRGAVIEYLSQEPALPAGESIRSVVLASLGAWSAARERHAALTEALAEPGGDFERLVAEQAEAGEAVERLGGWERLHEAEAIISHLGIPDSGRLVGTLSGGERRRVALARVLVRRPDLAILDEPTNHLDIETIEWLEDHLKNVHQGALLLITHDRYVLDRVTSRTVELDAGVLTSYAGGYVAYLEGKAERMAHAERVERNRQNFLRREIEWLRRQPKARGTKQKARIQRAQDALGAEAPRADRTAQLQVDSERLGRTILEISGLRLERAGRTLIDGLDLALAQGERIGIVGPNGSGKTSLLLCLQGQLAPSAGEVKLGANTRLGYLDQARGELDPEKTVVEEVAGEAGSIEVAGESMRVDAYLERFLFDRREARRKVGVLSGGERARVCLAKLLCQKINLLLLDEPTNDLDVSTLGALEQMLLDSGGSALVVSHDRWFLDRVATSILAFEESGEVDLHRGNYSEYREKRQAELRAVSRERTVRGGAQGTKGPTKRADGKGGRLGFKEQRELDDIFGLIESAEAEVGELERALADPATYERGGERLAVLKRSLDEARARAAALTERWEALEEKRAGLTGT